MLFYTVLYLSLPNVRTQEIKSISQLIEMDAAEKELNGFLHCHCVVVTQSRQLEQRITTSNQEILSEIDSIAIRVQVRGKEEEEENQADANEMK
jgi:hypothetical protein